MDLYFLCPVQKIGFWSAQWFVSDDLEVRLDDDGRRYLHGNVRVLCPLCGAEHVYAPDDISCPLSFSGDVPEDFRNTKGGE